MKKIILLFAIVTLTSVSLFAQIRGGGTAWVSSRTAALKTSTWFFAGTRGTLQLGAQVTVLQVNGNWAEVRSQANNSLSGWTSVNNLSARRIVSSNASVSSTEMAMAGKGFSQEVENAYKTDGTLNYGDVDRTEAISVRQEDLYVFMTEGRLFTGEE